MPPLPRPHLDRTRRRTEHGYSRLDAVAVIAVAVLFAAAVTGTWLRHTHPTTAPGDAGTLIVTLALTSSLASVLRARHPGRHRRLAHLAVAVYGTGALLGVLAVMWTQPLAALDLPTATLGVATTTLVAVGGAVRGTTPPNPASRRPRTSADPTRVADRDTH